MAAYRVASALYPTSKELGSVNTKFDKVYYLFLDELRNTGVTNMMGATPFLVIEFDLKRKEARNILMDWMNTFEERHPNEN